MSNAKDKLKELKAQINEYTKRLIEGEPVKDELIALHDQKWNLERMDAFSDAKNRLRDCRESLVERSVLRQRDRNLEGKGIKDLLFIVSVLLDKVETLTTDLIRLRSEGHNRNGGVVEPEGTEPNTNDDVSSIPPIVIPDTIDELLNPKNIEDEDAK